ncbi:AMP-dependent synthetase [Kyrpidia spormannii]|uniref:acetate--CoA ligase n=1 Tax=Kyrpidia spormannii TaxID=2055160 RepID=A0A2K8ND91_9BACL|nr:AMP-dependent synthetase [Kyrpidia spormannii]
MGGWKVSDGRGTGRQDPAIWKPEEAERKRTRLWFFMRRVGVSSLNELREGAARNPAWFWKEVADDLRWPWFEPYGQVLDVSRGVAWAKWFVGGKTNAAAACVDRHVGTEKDREKALIWEGEDGSSLQWTYEELADRVGRWAAVFHRLGVGKGDVVGVYLPMLPDTAAVLLACAKVGAIFTPVFSGYGAEAVRSRLADSGAKILITADGFYRRGKVVAMLSEATRAVEGLDHLRHVVVVSRVGAGPEADGGRGEEPGRARLLAADRLLREVSAEVATEVLDSETPLMIIYTSGTTGKPKGAVHTHVGFCLKAAQDLAHCFDLRDTDTLFWFTDMGWMMGPWAVFGGFALGATVLLYDGAPDYPSPDRLWRLVERHRVTHLGLAPTVIRSLMTQGDHWVERVDLSSLRVLGSTGEPWNPDPYMWFFDKVGEKRCPIINYSGGTEISGGILGCFVGEPIAPCSFAGPIPGMHAAVLDEEGRPVERGQVGELCILGPWVGMTRGFWNDPERYEQTYWSRVPGIWFHGDWVRIDEHGYWYIEGRSDDTLKVAGKRIGPAEIESVLVAHPAVAEAAAIGVPHAVKGEGIVGLVRLAPGAAPSEELRTELRDWVAGFLGKALRPEEIRFVRDLPKTRSGKIVRRVIKAKLLGLNPGDLSSLENPEALEALTE